MNHSIRLTVVTLLLAVSSLSAATHYVSLESTNPRPPYTNWATAATNIQQAVDAAAAGDEVVVTNAVYDVGQTDVGNGPSRVAITNAISVRSVNGPQFTVINGGGTNRCAFLTNGASLFGFTLTNGVASYGGGVWCASTNAFVTNCVIVNNWGGGAYEGTLYDCTLGGNFAYGGGGAYGCTLYNCTLIHNSSYAGGGGGASCCTLYNCTLSSNSVAGGYMTMPQILERDYNRTLSSNSVPGAYSGVQGGGSYPPGTGGAAYACTLYNCTLTGNSATSAYGWCGYGGGAFGCTLYNCIVYLNTAADGANYDSSSTLNYCCTTPLPPSGTGNITLNPQLASASHLSAESPCRGAGSTAYANGTDIDGEPWGNPPSIGCDEYRAGAVTGPLVVGLVASYTNVAVGYPVSVTALIEGRTSESVWDFGDGVVVSNRPYASHAWAAPADYTLLLRAYNESLPGGMSAAVTIHVVAQPVYCVAATSTSPQPPYMSWSTAATNIQDAVDAAAVPGALVLVTNGVYATGGRGGSWDGRRVVVDKPLTLRSVNGPEFTVINGGGSNRCVNLTDGASLTGFTLTDGAAYVADGGGVWCASPNAFLTNCVIAGNSAYPFYYFGGGGGGASGGTLYNCTLTGNSGTYGGGAYYSTLHTCVITNNSAPGGGGGAYGGTLYDCTLNGNSAWGGFANGGGASYSSTLYNCTLTGNSACYGGGASCCTLYNCTLTGNSASSAYGWGWGGYGGGAFGGTLYNCIVYYNDAPNGANYFTGIPDWGDQVSTLLRYSCTTPLPTTGLGNIDADPHFVNAATGDFRLLCDSPCINAGNNAYVSGIADLDGNPRISGGVVDMGAYEFVFTPSMEVARLILLVQGSNLGAKNKQPLLATLSAALASFERGNLNAGANQLHALQNKVRAQVARTDAALADELIKAAQQITEEVTHD